MLNKSKIFSQRKLFYVEQKLERGKLFRNTLFIALFTFSLHLFLMSLDTSILTDAIPEMLLQSYFSTFSLYNFICILFYTITFMLNYTYMTFAEVNENKWYLLIKAGFSRQLLIFMKLAVRLLEVFLSYALGFVFVFILTTFLKYPLTISYLFPLFLVGVIDILLLSTVVMAVSLFIRNKVNARYVLMAVYLMIQILHITSGYYSVISDRSLMVDSMNLLNPNLSYFAVYVLIVSVACVLMIIYGARKASTYTSFYFYVKDMDYDENAEIVIGDGVKFSNAQNKKYVDQKSSRIFDIIVNASMSLVIGLLIVFNLIVLAVSITSLNRNWNFLNVYPYVFQSNTMEPSIEFNDLTFFKGVNSDEVEADEIILYRSADTMVNVARVVEKNTDEWIVDFDHYPEETDPEILREKIQPDQVEGVYITSSRWLGLLVLFANTMIGRLLMLVLPSILIFFYQPIVNYIERLKRG